MKKAILIFTASIWGLVSAGQETQHFPVSVLTGGEPEVDFEAHPPLREMECGLWMNAAGDIALKTTGCRIDTLHHEDGDEYFLRGDNPPDLYIPWIYLDYDSDNGFAELKDVVDTLSFRVLNRTYYVDKDNVYIHPPVTCVMYINASFYLCNNIDRKTFRVFRDNPRFACDKDRCFFNGWEIEGADGATFQPIKDIYSRDKDHIYDGCFPMTPEQLAEYEERTGISLKSVRPLGVHGWLLYGFTGGNELIPSNDHDSVFTGDAWVEVGALAVSRFSSGGHSAFCYMHFHEQDSITMYDKRYSFISSVDSWDELLPGTYKFDSETATLSISLDNKPPGKRINHYFQSASEDYVPEWSMEYYICKDGKGDIYMEVLVLRSLSPIRHSEGSEFYKELVFTRNHQGIYPM